jgi:outer membrane lipoprotein-sorting protein
MLLTAAAQAAEIDRAAAAMAGTEAQFTQRFTPKGFRNSQVESGSVVFGTLPMMRWTYTRPEAKIFVFDGQKSWFYVPAEKQVTVSELDDQKRSELPFLMIGDPAARERHFVMREAPSGAPASRGPQHPMREAADSPATVVSLEPRSRTAMIRNITLIVAPDTHLIQWVEYTDREGNRTTFDFSGYQRREAGAEFFHFTPPPGVEVVQAQ